MLRQTWRWFGPKDKVSLKMAQQAGAEGIVTALHEVPAGKAWDIPAIQKRQALVKEAGMEWEVVESLAVSEDIKLGQGKWREHIGNYVTSLRNLAECGLGVVVYNFMPVLDWIRTDLAWKLESGGTAMRFDLVDFVVFELHILGRGSAADDYPGSVVEKANERNAALGEKDRASLAINIQSGLPGAAESWTTASLKRQLELYEGMDAGQLRKNQIAFLSEVVPEAEKLSIFLCCHPDDPPFPLLGLPRIMSTEQDYREVIDAVPSQANGINFCSGSLGSRADNDLPGFVARCGEHIHFAHLRNVTRDCDQLPCGFFEDGHLAGMADMVAIVEALLKEQERRKKAGNENWRIPMRPDHGQDLMDDLGRGAMPGYPAIGRLRGLAELRGVMSALARIKA